MTYNIEKIINEWDPLDLFPFAPKDEYELEIKEISSFLESSDNYTVDDLAKRIHSVFRRTLGDDIYNMSFKSCFEVAKKLSTVNRIEK